jgi:hypothetical protein
VRKQLITFNPTSTLPPDQSSLDVERKALVEVTSEANGYPIECAPIGEVEGGWRAAKPGAHMIRLVFDERQRLKHLFLVFEDPENTRTQGFVLRWSPDSGHSLREIERQQWNFSPSGSARELEDYAVEVSEVSVLELTIVSGKRPR